MHRMLCIKYYDFEDVVDGGEINKVDYVDDVDNIDNDDYCTNYDSSNTMHGKICINYCA